MGTFEKLVSTNRAEMPSLELWAYTNVIRLEAGYFSRQPKPHRSKMPKKKYLGDNPEAKLPQTEGLPIRPILEIYYESVMAYNAPNSFQQGHPGPQYDYTLRYQPRKYHSDPPSPGDVNQRIFPSENIGGPFIDDRHIGPRFPAQGMSTALGGQIPYSMFGPSQMPAPGRTVSANFHPQHPHGFGMDDFLPALNDSQGAYVSHPSPGSEAEDSDELFSSPIPPVQFPPHEETEAYLRQNFNIMPPRPVDLSALPDQPFSGKAPKITDMIKLAIWGSRHKRLTLNQIYAEIENRYPSWKAAKDKPWQRSIRHNLSLKAIFVHQERPVSHPGKGHYWMLDYRQGEGNKRDRKRMPGSKASGMSDESDSERLVPDSRRYKGPPVTTIASPALHVPLGMATILPGPGGFYHVEGDSSIAQPTLGLGHPVENSNLRPGPPPSIGPNMRWTPSSYTGDPTSMAQSISYSGYGGLATMSEQHAGHQPPTGNPYPVGPSYASASSSLTIAAHTLPPARPRRAHSGTVPEKDAAENARGSRRHRIR